MFLGMKKLGSPTGCCMPTFPELARQRQENRELKASLSYIARALRKEKKSRT